MCTPKNIFFPPQTWLRTWGLCYGPGCEWQLELCTVGM